MGLTQDFVADQLNLSRQAISNWENNTRDINVRDLIAYAKLLEISFDDLEIHLNHPKDSHPQFETFHQGKPEPSAFDAILTKIQGKNASSSRPIHIPIEGDRVIGVHTLLTSLLFNGQVFQIQNCPSSIDFLNILYEFSHQSWAKITVREKDIALTTDQTPYDLTPLTRNSRASIGLISALTYKYHRLLFSFPAEEDYQTRPIDLHLDALSSVASYRHNANDKIYYSEKNDLLNKNISLHCYGDGSKSVGAFFNAISLAYVNPSEIRINGLSPDPTVAFLISLLENASNRVVNYLTPDKIVIPKVDSIQVKEHRVVLPPDLSMLVAYVLLGWEKLDELIFDQVTLTDIPDNYRHFFSKLGLSILQHPQALQFQKTGEIDKNYFTFLRFGGTPFLSTDLCPIISEFLAFHDIPAILFDEIFEPQSQHIEELEKLGIHVTVLENGALQSKGKIQDFKPTSIDFTAKDFRSGMAILMGILHKQIPAANFHNYDQVLHGYGNIQKTLQELGYEGEIYGKEYL